MIVSASLDGTNCIFNVSIFFEAVEADEAVEPALHPANKAADSNEALIFLKFISFLPYEQNLSEHPYYTAGKAVTSFRKGDFFEIQTNECI
jgi:hypothetical protein